MPEKQKIQKLKDYFEKCGDVDINFTKHQKNQIQKIDDKCSYGMRKLKNINDIESQHIEADKILCKVLKEIGFTKIVKEFWEVPKWYA